MLSVIKIETIGELIEFAFSINTFNYKMQRYMNSFVFRGQKNINFQLSSSLKRHSTRKDSISEMQLLNTFQKYGQIDDARLIESIWESMIIAQHHGLPTRLLDWTYSPLIALHFATDHIDDKKTIEYDSVIWAVRLKEINDLLPQKYINLIKIHKTTHITFELLKELKIDINTYDNDMGKDSFIFFEPPSMDMRIVNQASVFAILPRKLDPLDEFLKAMPKEKIDAYKIIIPKDKMYVLRDQLDSMNINERILFPGLDGTAKWVRRRLSYRYIHDKI